MTLQHHPAVDPLTTPVDAGPACPAPRLADLSALTRVSLHPVSALADYRAAMRLAEIEAAARAAAIDEDIRTFADGYQAVIGERGVKLSGGQRQRLALSRALLCDRPMLIIDDALSAIDVETEQQVLQGILAGLAGKSVLLISHRINVLRHAERIVVLDEGRIVAEGRHEDLLATPFYRVMADKQRNDA